MVDPLALRLRHALGTQQLMPPRSRVVIGVSGGVDSMALLHLLVALRSAYRWTLHVAHLDHGLRERSSEDAAFVERIASSWQVETTIAREDIQAICHHHRWSLEDGARRIRRRFLLEVAQHHRADLVALAHTADDQAETVLMRLLRGTGLSGLGAMSLKCQMQGQWIVRPLLEMWRHELLAYLQRAHVSVREDPSNADLRFLRNRIRHELLPLLEQRYNPQIKQALTQLAEQSRCDYAYLHDATGRQWKRTVKKGPDQMVAISIAAFRHQPKAIQRQLVRQAIQQVRGQVAQVEFRHWREAERLFTDHPVGARVDLPGGVQLRRERERVLCQRLSTGESEERVGWGA